MVGGVAYTRSLRFLAGAKIESSGKSAATLRLRASILLPPKMVNTTAPLPKPARTPFRNPLRVTPPDISVCLAISVFRSVRKLGDIIEQPAQLVKG